MIKAQDAYKRTICSPSKSIVRLKQLKDGKDTEATLSETILPDAGIVGELRRFIEAIENNGYRKLSKWYKNNSRSLY